VHCFSVGVIRARRLERAVVYGAAAGRYLTGLLGLRTGSLLCEAVGRLVRSWDVLLVDATGRDHPRRAGLALHLGAVLGQPSLGVTNQALVADGAWPEDTAGAVAPLLLDGEAVGFLAAFPRRRPADSCARGLVHRPGHGTGRRHGMHRPRGALIRFGRHAESRAKPGQAPDQVDRHDLNGRARRALDRRTGRRRSRVCRWAADALLYTLRTALPDPLVCSCARSYSRLEPDWRLGSD
jgi:hypothetical protein